MTNNTGNRYCKRIWYIPQIYENDVDVLAEIFNSSRSIKRSEVAEL
jgi:hypothetical protein